MPSKRSALTRALLQEAAQKRDDNGECQFAIDNPRGLSIRVRGGEAAYYVQARTRVRGVKSTVVKRRLGAVSDFTFAQGADSGDCGQGFRLNATMHSDRRRPPVPTKAAGVWLPA